MEYRQITVFSKVMYIGNKLPESLTRQKYIHNGTHSRDI